jgi:putative ABC transport system permease protein
MIKDYFFLAFGNLKHRGVRSWLTLLGIFIGIMAVVSLISLGSGLKLAVAAQFGISSTEVITIRAGGINSAGPPGSAVTSHLEKSDVDTIGKLSTVEIAFSRIITSGKLEFNDIVDFWLAVSIPDGRARKFAYETVELEAEFGRMLKDGDTNKVVLGNNFYSNEESFGKRINIGDKILLQDKKFEVVGILKKKGSFLWDNFVMVNERPLVDLMNYGDRVDVIIVKVKNKDLMERSKEEIERKMRELRKVKIGKEDFEVSTPEAALGTVNSILGGVQAFIIIIAFISIFVGAIGIVNTMTTSVLERKNEIGIMKSIGAKNSHIFMQFFIESGLLGFVGGLIGVIFGLGIGFLGIYGINSFIGSEIILKLDYFLIVASLLGSFFVGAISGVIPAWNASKLNPVDALRN